MTTNSDTVFDKTTCHTHKNNIDLAASMPSRKILFWLGFVFLFFGAIYVLSNILLPFVLGILIAYFFDPAADRLERMGVSRAIATSIIISLFFLILVFSIIALAPLLVQQVSDLVTNFPSYLNYLREIISEQMQHLPEAFRPDTAFDLKSLSQENLSSGKAIVSRILRSGMAIVNLLSLLIITPVVAFYLLRDWDKMVAEIDDLLPRNYAHIIREQVKKVDETLAGFLRGQFNVMLILGSFYAIALLLVGLKHAIVIGIVAGFLIIIPYLGAFISGALATTMAFIQFDDPLHIGLVLGIFVVGQMMEGYFLTPKLVGDRVNLHPVWIIFGMLAGGSLFGFVGILIAVPVTAIIGVLIRFAVNQYQTSGLYASQTQKQTDMPED